MNVICFHNPDEENGYLKRQLVDTGDAVLAECAVRDQIWGIGLSMGDPNRFERSKWKGYNLLGYALLRLSLLFLCLPLSPESTMLRGIRRFLIM